MNDIEERVKNVVVKQLGVEPYEVTLDSSFSKDLGGDSLDEVELVMEIEEEFEIEIPDEDVAKLDTFRKLVDYVNERIG